MLKRITIAIATLLFVVSAFAAETDTKKHCGTDQACCKAKTPDCCVKDAACCTEGAKCCVAEEKCCKDGQKCDMAEGAKCCGHEATAEGTNCCANHTKPAEHSCAKHDATMSCCTKKAS